MKLGIFEDRYESYVAWNDDGEPGAWIGQDGKTPVAALKSRQVEAKKSRDFDDYEYLAVEIAAQDWVKNKGEDYVSSSGCGYSFQTEGQARTFIAAMRAAMKVARAEYDTDVPWPEWAKQATAAGWKSPKGWKP